MLRKYLIEDVTKKYVTQSKELQKLKDLNKDITDLCVNLIHEVYPQEVFDFQVKHPEYVKKQDNLNVVYSMKRISWRQRYMISNCGGKNVFDITLDPLNLPTLIPNSDVVRKDSEFRAEFPDFCEKFEKFLDEMQATIDSITKKVGAIEHALGAESMNKSSIKKYYNELYKFIYGDE